MPICGRGWSVIQVEFGRQSGRLFQSYSACAEACEAGGLRVVCSVSAVQTMLRLGLTCIRIQDAFGADVETVWNTDTRRDGMTGCSCSRHTVEESVCLPPGVYTAVVTFYAKNALGSDSVSCRTKPVRIR